MTETVQCRKCKEPKRPSEMGKSQSRRWCRDCNAEYMRDYRERVTGRPVRRRQLRIMDVVATDRFFVKPRLVAHKRLAGHCQVVVATRAS